jgi:hypothetical protein
MTIIANDEDFTLIDGRKVLKDGKKITVPLILADHATVTDTGSRHRPGPRTTTDAKASDAYAAMVRDLGDAWCHPVEPPPVAERTPPATNAQDRAYTEMVHGLEDAWKGAA